jgi:hypothetical protein
MSSRDYRHPETQGIRHTYMPVRVLPNGTGTPTLSEGDSAGSYFSIAHTSTGVLTLTTKERFLAVVRAVATINLGTPAGQWTCQTTCTQNSNQTWAITINMFDGATATDIAAATGNVIDVDLVFRNSIGLP